MAKLVFNAEMLAKSVGCKNGNEIVFEEYFEIRKSDGSEPQDPKFEYFKKKVLDHLDKVTVTLNGNDGSGAYIDEQGNLIVPQGAPVKEYENQSTLWSGFRKQISQSALYALGTGRNSGK